MVRSDTSSSVASSRAISRPRDWRRSRTESSLVDRMDRMVARITDSQCQCRGISRQFALITVAAQNPREPVIARLLMTQAAETAPDLGIPHFLITPAAD